VTARAPRHQALTPRTLRKAEQHLAAVDPVMADIVRQVGRCRLVHSRREDPFSALVEAIVRQQLSTRAAGTIYGRVRALFPGDGHPTPEAVLAAPIEALRAAGLSRAKVLYLRDLASKIIDNTVSLDQLDALTDDEIVKTMTQVKGIGRWSAEMFLMFRLQRPDVMPVGDLGIVNAMRRHYRLRKKPTAERMHRIANAWRPYRSVACWYLWASLDNKPGS
jgi:DNA-3-methyladenine glycosylase II